MKKQIAMATMMIVAGTAMMGGCSSKDEFKTTEKGLGYRFEKSNPTGQQVKENDVLVAELTVKFDTMTLFSNVGNPDRILQAMPSSFDGDLSEGLMMMHTGEKAVFAVDADVQARYVDPRQMPPTYKAGEGQKFYYEINLIDIVSAAEIEAEQANREAEMNRLREAEPEAIAQYVAEKGIRTAAGANGVYTIIKRKGTGTAVATGREVAMNYTGRLLDGTMFDTSVESDAREGGIYQQGRPYEPLTYRVGEMGLIPGWEQGVMGQPAGTVLQLIIPSAMAYGPQGAAGLIPPYSPLVFDIEIVSVK